METGLYMRRVLIQTRTVYVKQWMVLFCVNLIQFSRSVNWIGLLGVLAKKTHTQEHRQTDGQTNRETNAQYFVCLYVVLSVCHSTNDIRPKSSVTELKGKTFIFRTHSAVKEMAF